MTKVVVPVDGSENSLHAVEIVLKQIKEGSPLDVHLLNVQPHILSGHARMYLKREVIDGYFQEEAAKALKSARELLDQAGVKYSVDVEAGNVPETIAEFVKSRGCDMVVMGTRGLGSVYSMVLGSVTTKVLHLVDVPVTLVK